MTRIMELVNAKKNHFKIASCEKKYFQKCQIYTPNNIIKKIWQMVHERQNYYNKVLDLGAGDGRFSKYGNYGQYIGIEIDKNSVTISNMPSNASVMNQCAFSFQESNFDLCIGNPPYVRHQELEASWKQEHAKILSEKLNENFTQSANIFVYFLAQALLKTKDNGLVSLVIPYEWVSRPSTQSIRNYINKNKWSVHVYRFKHDVFLKVLTTASITIIDKKDKSNTWNYYEIEYDLSIQKIKQPTGTDKKLLDYSSRTKNIYAQRGLSPGKQNIFCLTEDERQQNNLKIGSDVLPCIVSLKPLDKKHKVLTKKLFEKLYVQSNQRCWLVNSQTLAISKELLNYFNGIPYKDRDTWTCNNRDVWWKFHSVKPPTFLYASAFTSYGPKAVINRVGAISVNSAPGIYTDVKVDLYKFLNYIKNYDFESRIVNHSGKLKRIEINQMNSVIQEFLQREKII